ncbi:MAG: D-glycero-beta-D-manno-heptose 1-phosphate adenylyltransferase [Oligoflexia bacterium]|nr:D-glycero-beta-D-manno-heptose 1-phosphate adenylyltransferase [Oligoflexia bacterium]
MNKFIEPDKIEKTTESVHRKNKKIVFTNGCFDILHAGHADYLEKAKKLGDVLIVGVNSDKSIKRIKGDKRPVVTQENRIRLLSSIAFIDYITVFEEDTPLELIKKIRPHVLVKGSDWKDKGVVGGDFVKSTGGRVELIELLPGISTSSIIERILDAYNEKHDCCCR